MATIQEIHKTHLQMLRFFDDFCEQNGLRYVMAGGTMLGAYRHHGFIPWDDDVDLYRPIEDAKKFQKCFQSEEYCLQTPETDFEAPYIMFRIRKKGTRMIQKPVEEYVNINKGIWMDIFLYTNAGKTAFAKKLQLFTMRILQSFRCRFYHARCHKKKILHAVLAKLPRSAALLFDDFLSRLICLLGNESSGEVFVWEVVDPYFWPQNVIDRRLRYCFEGVELWGMEDYNAYLSQSYGEDYMTPKKWGHFSDYSEVQP